MTISDNTFASSGFAQFRDWYRGETVVLLEYPALAAAWNRTQQTLAEIRERLHSETLPNEIETIYVCGSMGRMEQVHGSDCDLVIVVDHSAAPQSRLGSELFNLIWNKLSNLDFERPKSGGIFSQVVSWDQLVSRASLGIVDESQFVYGTRIQLLLDSQPVYQTSRFEDLSANILDRAHQPDSLGRSNWIPLLAELMRYWRSLCTRTFWLSPENPGMRRTITMKLNHSRLVLIAGLLMLLGEASSQEFDSRGYLFRRLCLTPLERIVSCTSETAARRIVSHYDEFLSRMSDAEFIARLQDPSLELQATSEFNELENNARQLKTALLSSIVDRSHAWPITFRESLIL